MKEKDFCPSFYKSSASCVGFPPSSAMPVYEPNGSLLLPFLFFIPSPLELVCVKELFYSNFFKHFFYATQQRIPIRRS